MLLELSDVQCTALIEALDQFVSNEQEAEELDAAYKSKHATAAAEVLDTLNFKRARGG